MTRRLRLAACLSLFFAIPLVAATPRRRAINPINEVTILQTTDVHDHANGAGHVGLDVDPVTGMGTVGAYARMAAYINSVRSSTTHPVVLVDSGDWTMGTIYDLTLASRPLALYFLTALRYDVVTLGNHEFDYTPKGLATMLAAAKSAFNFQTPIVASNMNLNGNADLAPYTGAGKQIQPAYVETLANGTKIGFIGLMGEDAAIDAPASAPVSFTPLSSSYPALQTLVNDLRNNQGAQIVVALSHSGTDASGTSGEDIKLAQHVRGIDVIASGHTHTPLASAHAVKNGDWTTEVIDAGAFGTNVARLDLRITPGGTSLLAYNNVPMTGAQADPTMAGVVNATDKQLNAQLGPVLSQFFSDYDAANLAKGVYHAAGATAQTLVPNDQNAVLAPNGLGNLAADAVRNAPNAIIAQTLAGVGGNPANLPGYDFTPVQLAVVGTGVIRSPLQGGVPLSFADIYDVLPLGISPDTSQALPIGYPLVSSYIDVADVKKVAALQLVGMSNLIGSSFYLNLSGISYTLKPAELDTYFKYATAAAVLDVTTRKAAAGSTAALQTVGALFNLGMDQGASLMAAYNAKNPYAVAMVSLNNATPTQSDINTNLQVVGNIGGAAIYGTSAVASLVVSKAIDAIGTISGFAATDLTNTGSATDLTTGRIRAVADLYAILLLNAVQAQYGVAITPYQSATGSTVLSPADFPTLLGNRIDASPSTPGVQELKEWMALMQDVGVGLHGQIGTDYASTTNFSQFPTFGAAVKTRNASYPLSGIAQLVTTVAGLGQAP